LEEDTCKTFAQYGDPPNLGINPRANRFFPRLPGQVSQPARYGEYLGSSREEMPDPDKPKYGSEDKEKWNREGAVGQQR